MGRFGHAVWQSAGPRAHGGSPPGRACRLPFRLAQQPVAREGVFPRGVDAYSQPISFPTAEPAVKALLQPENRLFLLTVLVAALSAVVTAWPEALQH